MKKTGLGGLAKWRNGRWTAASAVDTYFFFQKNLFFRQGLHAVFFFSPGFF
jgi:hypothetical protein